MDVPNDLELEHKIEQNNLLRVLNLSRGVLGIIVLMFILHNRLGMDLYKVAFGGVLVLLLILLFAYRYRESYKIYVFDRGVKFSSGGLPKKFRELYVDYKDIDSIRKKEKWFGNSVLVVKDIHGDKYKVNGMYINKILPYLHDNLEGRWDYVYEGRGESS